MQSSREGNLGLKSKMNFSWKGRTLRQITSVIQKTQTPKYQNKSFYFKALPYKGYRRELPVISNLTIRNNSTIRNVMETPGSNIVTSRTNIDCKGYPNTLEAPIEKNTSEHPCNKCDDLLRENTAEYNNSRYLRSFSAEDNARRRVRSSGMTKPRYDSKKNGRMESFMSSKQYLHSRNKTFSQNQFNNIRKGDSSKVPGTSDTVDHVYASNTIQHCDGNLDAKTNYVPIHYKPNNAKFATQGSVDASARLLRLKYDTITDVGNKMREPYGVHTANALTYGVPANGYTIKDKFGYPNICSPKFPKGYTCKA